MAKSETYTVIAGNYDRPAYLQGQYLEKGYDRTGKDQGTGQPTGEQRLYALRRQDIGIPNYAQAWGVRVYDDGAVPENPMDVKDVKYHGKINFLSFGDPKGTLIEVRWLKNYNTIDMQYQNLVLNAKVDENDPSSADAFFIVLQSGENDFDSIKDAMKIQMLKVTSYNRNSPCRQPDALHDLFYEKNEETNIKVESKSLNAKGDALRIVTDASSDNTFGKLKNLFNIVRVLSPEEPKEAHLYVFLQHLADKLPVEFLAQIDEYKKYVSNIFEKLKSYKSIDWTKDGMLVAGDDKKEVICEGIPAKGENMLLWLLTNHLDPKANEAIFKLTKISEKLK